MPISRSAMLLPTTCSAAAGSPRIGQGEKGKVYVSNVKPGISTTGRREEGFKLEMN